MLELVDPGFPAILVSLVSQRFLLGYREIRGPWREFYSVETSLPVSLYFKKNQIIQGIFRVAPREHIKGASRSRQTAYSSYGKYNTVD